MLLVAPALAALVARIAPIIGEVLPGSFGPHDVDSLRTFGALLAPWTLAALLVNLLLPAMFALGKVRLVNLLAVPLVLAHVAATVAGGALFGIDGVVGAAFLAPLAFAAVLLTQAAGRARGELTAVLLSDGLRVALPAVAGFAVGAALAELMGGGLAGYLVAGLVGSGLYAAILRLAAPRQARVLGRGLRPLASER